MYRLGQIIGLPLGGFLAHPERQFPNTFFDGPFWQKYPFVLPCFFGAAFALFAVALGTIFLDEVRCGTPSSSLQSSHVLSIDSPV
jgi:hypothetical protein